MISFCLAARVTAADRICFDKIRWCRGIPSLGARLAAAVGAGKLEGQVADLTAAFLLDRERGFVGLRGSRLDLGIGIRGHHDQTARACQPSRVCQALSTFTISSTHSRLQSQSMRFDIVLRGSIKEGVARPRNGAPESADAGFDFAWHHERKTKFLIDVALPSGLRRHRRERSGHAR